MINDSVPITNELIKELEKVPYAERDCLPIFLFCMDQFNFLEPSYLSFIIIVHYLLGLIKNSKMLKIIHKIIDINMNNSYSKWLE